MPAGPPGDQAPNTALQRIAEAVKNLRSAAGNPSLRAISAAIGDGKYSGTASHTSIGLIINAKQLTAWATLEAVVLELVRMRESLQPLPEGEDEPPAKAKARRQALVDEQTKQSTRLRILWLEARQERKSGESDGTRANERFSLNLYRLLIEPFKGVSGVSAALRSLDVAKHPRAADLANHFPGIVDGGRTPQIWDIEDLLELRRQSGRPVDLPGEEEFRESYAELLRWTSPTLYEFLRHHQEQARAHAQQLHALQAEAHSASRLAKAADLEVFQSSVVRHSADNKRLTAYVKTQQTRINALEAEVRKLRHQINRYESDGADTPMTTVNLDHSQVLQGPMIPGTAPTGRPAEPSLHATIPSWEAIVPRQQPAAHFDAFGWSSYTPGATQELPYPGEECEAAFSYSAAPTRDYSSGQSSHAYAVNTDLRRLSKISVLDPYSPFADFPDQKNQLNISESAANRPSEPANEALALPPGQHARKNRKKSYLKSFFTRGRGKHARRETRDDRPAGHS
jgi:hypothetical protein